MSDGALIRSRRLIRASVQAAMVVGLTMPLPTSAQADKPQYGGTLTIGARYLTVAPTTRDPAAWSVTFEHFNGLMYEQLFAADLDKSVRKGGKYPFIADGWLPSDAIRGELAESWAWKQDPLRVEVKLRKGVMFPDKPGVMKSRELVAQDVVDSFNVLDKSPKKYPAYFDHVTKVEAVDSHTVAFQMTAYNAEWDYRFGWGLFCGIVPREVIAAGAADWKNANGTGPFVLADVVQGATTTFARNPVYWAKERIGGQSYPLPFVDRIVYPTIKDEATYLAALRTGKLDVLENLRWSAVDELKRSAPGLVMARHLETATTALVLRVDTKPFDDVRVRRALNMAINKKEIVESHYGGHAELLAFPMHPHFLGYYEPLEAMPSAVQELFVYDPDKARALLAEAGHPKGFSFKVQACACDANALDLLPLIAAYLEKVGVKIEIETLEYPAFVSARLSRKHAPGVLNFLGHGSPVAALRRYFGTGQAYNFSLYADAGLDERLAKAIGEPDESKRQQLVKLMTRDLLDKAPWIWLPVAYHHTAWWPWVKNYGGELRAGAERPGPIHARMWVDQDLKKKMGY